MKAQRAELLILIRELKDTNPGTLEVSFEKGAIFPQVNVFGKVSDERNKICKSRNLGYSRIRQIVPCGWN